MLNKLRDEVHKNAMEHGWWEKDFNDEEIKTILNSLKQNPEMSQKVIKKITEQRHFGSLISLMHSELSEALEEFRNGNPLIYFQCSSCNRIHVSSDNIVKVVYCCGKPMKPEGIHIELADCIIRILDYCGHANIDIDAAIGTKHEYNKTRPYRHGGKAI